DRRLRSERDRGETEQHGQAAHQDPLGVTRSHGYNVTMTVPATSRQTRTFEDRADALAQFFVRAAEAPRLLAYDDAVGCPLDQALAARGRARHFNARPPRARAAPHPPLAAGPVHRAAGRKQLYPDARGVVCHRWNRRIVPTPSAQRTVHVLRSRGGPVTLVWEV